MSYETDMNKLEELTEKIGSPETDIEESLSLYEQGVTIASRCLKQLNELKGRVTVLQRDLNKMIETDLKDAEDDE